MVAHAEMALSNSSMMVHSISDLIQLSQGVQAGSENVMVDSDDEVDDEIQRPIQEEAGDLDVDSDDDDDLQGPALEVVWRIEKLFENQKDLNAFLTAENCWVVDKRKPLTRGLKIIYRCNKVRRRGLQCSSGIYTLQDFEPNNPKIQLFRKNLDHNCEHSLNKVVKMSDEVRQMIINKYIAGDKLQAILYTLRENENIIQPTKSQVTSVIDSYNRKKHGDPNVTLTDLENFANDWKAIPENEDATFVVNFGRSQPQSDQKLFRLFYSTKRLLRTTSQSKVIHVDGTYKLTIQGFPVLVVGVSDYTKHFHLSGMAICTNETAADYSFILRSIRIGIALLYEIEYKPKYLIADADKAITNACNEVFGENDITRINCFAHLMMNVDKKKFRSAESKVQIKNDIRKLRFAYSEPIFDMGCELFLKKWTTLKNEFIMVFKNFYIENNNLWYAGAIRQGPLTNNCLEGFNHSFKLHQSHYKRQNLSVFKDSMLKFVHQRSAEYIQDRTHFVDACVVDDGLLYAGWEYSVSQKSFISEKIQNSVAFYVFAGNNMEKISMEDVKRFEEQTFKDFDDYIAKRFTIYQIVFSQNVQDWKCAQCTCASYCLD